MFQIFQKYSIFFFKFEHYPRLSAGVVFCCKGHHHNQIILSIVIILAIDFKKKMSARPKFQVSTPTGSVSHYYNLGIIVPRAYILGADEYVVNNISIINIIIIIIIINNIFIIDIIIIIFIIFTTWTSLSQELTSLEPMSMSGHQ